MHTYRLPFMLLAMVGLLLGLLTGLQRMGWNLPFTMAAASHGAIMTGGFIGTLITLEKIIPLKKKVLYVLPVLSGISVVLFFAQQPVIAKVCLVTASVGLSLVFLGYLLREKSLIYALMMAGALCWFVGNVLLLINGFYPVSLPWWMAFVLLVITSERLELMKFLPVSRNQKSVFVVMLALFIVACLLSFHGIGSYVAAVSLAGVSVWLMRFDVVRINLKKNGLTRYTGVALLAGYCSLLLTGICIPLLAAKPLGYDVLVHIFFIGFVFSMIFAHGPIILPGVLGISLKPYHPVLYVWLTILHLSWVLRAAFDLGLDLYLRRFTGLASGIAMLGYFVSLIVITMYSYRAKSV